MQEFSSRNFFSFEKPFLHEKLFDPREPVWRALEALSPYLKKMKLGKIEVEVPPTVYLVNSSLISIAEGCVIEPGAYIQGPVILGPRTVVRHGAYVSDVIAGEGCVIGHCSEVKRSILLDGAKAPHFNYVGDSILGVDVNLGAGVKLANFRFDHAAVTFLHQGKKVVTGLKKLGAIIGDGVQIGCNAVTNPGTLIGPQAFCYPCTHIVGVVPPRAVYKNQRVGRRT